MSLSFGAGCLSTVLERWSESFQYMFPVSLSPRLELVADPLHGLMTLASFGSDRKVQALRQDPPAITEAATGLRLPMRSLFSAISDNLKLATALLR